MQHTITKNCLQTILNECLLTNNAKITLASTLLDLDLLTVDLDKGEFRSMAGPRDFDPVVSDLQRKLGQDFLAQDVPGHGDLADALRSSLLLPPDNLNELMKEIKDIEARRRNPYRYPRMRCFAIDTNVAYNRLLTRLPSYGQGCGVVDFDPNSISVVVPDMVEREVSYWVQHKYTPKDLEVMVRTYGERSEVRSLSNCCLKSGRRALNAQTEINLIRESYATWPVYGGEFDLDKEKRDREMVKVVGEEMYLQKWDVLFLTADDKFRAHTNAEKVPAFLLRYPKDVPSALPYDPWRFAEFLYDLAINFGIISFKSLGLRVFGDWSGKTVDDFKQEKIRVIFDDRSALGKALDRDCRIMQRLSQRFDLNNIS